MRKGILVFLSLAILASTFISGTARASLIVPANSINPVQPDSATVKSAVAEFRALSRKERRERIKEVKKELKTYKREKRSGNEPSTNTVLLAILAILLPPLAVYLHEGEINNRFWISLVLTLLFWLPGVIYALIVVLGKD